MSDYKKFCSYRLDLRKKTILNLSRVTFFCPTTVLPLAALIKEEKPKLIPPTNSAVRAYLETVTDSSRFDKKVWNTRSYLPCVPLPNQKDKAEDILQWIYEKHDRGKKCGGKNAFIYLIGELVDNIYEHSEFNRAWVVAQAYTNAGHMDICFFDNGITINGCFEKHGIKSNGGHDAIKQAVNGKSTKSEDRGYGLSSNMNMVTKGMNGQILIISGDGGMEINPEQNPQPYHLPKGYELLGTMISVRIPYPASVVNIFDYVEQ